MGLLSGKSAVVTGSSRGLGRAFVLVLAEYGAKVVVNGTVAEDVHKVVQEIKDKGGEALPCVESVASWEGAKGIIQTAVDNYGGIDILVNNAGIIRDRMLINMTEEEWDEVIAVHLKGTFACTRFALPFMREKKGGRIINVTAAGGLRGRVGQTNYTAAKAGIAGMTRTWALELSRYNITVNAIQPVARTRMTEPLIERAKKAAIEAGNPEPSAGELGLGEPEDIACLVVFLASDEASWLNGQIIASNGDRLALWSHPKMIRFAFMPGGWTVELLQKHFKTAIGELEGVGESLGTA